jgi:mannose-6-phosphate isomerase-like protein (cupin superfamily)
VSAIDVRDAQRRLLGAGGGYEVVHASTGLEVGVYVLVAPEADRQQPHEHDELYAVLEGSCVLDVARERIPLDEGKAAFVPAGVEHRFSGYERLSVLVVFARTSSAPGMSFAPTPGPGNSEGGDVYAP